MSPMSSGEIDSFAEQIRLEFLSRVHDRAYHHARIMRHIDNAVVGTLIAGLLCILIWLAARAL